VRQQSAGRTAGEQKARLVSEMLAFAIGAGLDGNNFDLVQTAFNWARSDSSTVFVLVLDEANSPIVEHNPQRLQYEKAKVLSQGVVEGAKDLVIAVSPIEYKGKRLGHTVIGVSLEAVKAGVKQQIVITSVVNLVIMVLGIGVIVVMARLLVRDLKAVQVSIDNADLNTRINTSREDEVGDLQNSFDRFVGSIRQTLLQVSESAASVASASAQISSSAEEMAAGAQEQTSQSEEVSGAVEQMAKTITVNARGAGEAAETAEKAKGAAEQGGRVVQETVEEMKRIAEVVRGSAGTIRDLGRSSDQIGEIIGVIDDIADQTNLLALNAAIEAARAGEQGRGFAVVADEVRKLAEQTTKATKQISGMIQQIQADTQGAVRSMDQATKQVDEGIVLADRAGVSLREIVQISQRLTQMVAQIAAASEEQSSASEQISKNVEAITTVTQETASGTHQIARAAEDLNRLTETLQRLVGQFKLSAEQAEGTLPPLPKTAEAPKRSRYLVKGNGSLVQAENDRHTKGRFPRPLV
jgi:methyl-accepting chemotaxis protein